MLSSGYPDIGQHKREHRKFQRDMSELSERISAHGVTLIDLVQTNKALVSWLVNYVQAVDQKFGSFLKDAAKPLPPST
jgi:hemerythrin